MCPAVAEGKILTLKFMLVPMLTCEDTYVNDRHFTKIEVVMLTEQLQLMQSLFARPEGFCETRVVVLGESDVHFSGSLDFCLSFSHQLSSSTTL